MHIHHERHAPDAAAYGGVFRTYYLFRIKVGSGYRLWPPSLVVINYAAYFAEIYRSGIQSMPVGQYEAAQILGYSRFQTFFKIILPQVINGFFRL